MRRSVRWIRGTSAVGMVTVLGLAACRAATGSAPTLAPPVEESLTPPPALLEYAETHAPGSPPISVDLRGVKGEIDRLWSWVALASGDLSDSVDELCNHPSVGGLERSQEAWRQLRRSWNRAQVGHFGDLTEERLEAQLSWWPANEARIMEILEGDEDIDRDLIREQGATVKGLNALEPFLFPRESGDDTPNIQPLDPSLGPLDERRCDYAKSVAEVMVGAASNGHSSSNAMLGRQDYLNALVNHMVTVSQDVDGMLAKPLGRRSGGTPQPETIQGALSRSTVADAMEGVCGLRQVWRGGGEPRCPDLELSDGYAPPTVEAEAPRLADLVIAIQPQTAVNVDHAITEALAALQAIPEPFATTLATDPGTIELAFHAAKVLERTLATELSSVLGVSLTFNANDGD